MLVRANEVSSAELRHLVRVCAPNLLGQTRVDDFLYQQDIYLARSFVALHLGEYAGVALLGERQTHLHLCMLAVRAELRSRGFGRALLEAAISDAKPQTLSLDVWSQNVRALDMYYSTGFNLQRSSCFWYRPLPLRWESAYNGCVHNLAPDIALDMTENSSLAWAAQGRSLRRRALVLRGAVYMEQGVVRGVALFKSGLEKVTVYRFTVANIAAAKALFRHMHLITPSASAIFLRWTPCGQSDSLLQELGLRCYSVYHTLERD